MNGCLWALCYVKSRVRFVCLPVCFSVRVPPYVVKVSIGKLATFFGFPVTNSM